MPSGHLLAECLVGFDENGGRDEVGFWCFFDKKRRRMAPALVSKCFFLGPETFAK
jgi:hypothetical protein